MITKKNVCHVLTFVSFKLKLFRLFTNSHHIHGHAIISRFLSNIRDNLQWFCHLTWEKNKRKSLATEFPKNYSEAYDRTYM